MLGTVGYTGSGSIPFPGDVALVVFVVAVCALTLCAFVDRRPNMPNNYWLAGAIITGIVVAQVILCALRALGLKC